MQLYTRAASSCSFRIRIALGVKKLPWEAVLVDVAMQQSDKYQDLNPQALVPFLIDGKAKIGQTLAILEYLGEVYCSGWNDDPRHCVIFQHCHERRGRYCWPWLAARMPSGMKS